MRIVRKAIVPAIPKELLITVIDSISDALAKDAKERFGGSYRFKVHKRLVGENALETYVQFFPYKYDFIWKITPDKLGHEIVLDARTPGKWRDSLFGMGEKLEGLTNTQWSALTNFCHGYLTALAQRSPKTAKARLRKSRKRIRER